MYKITFKYRDALSNFEWRIQTCTMSSVEQCVLWYGLGTDCDYEILDVEKIGD